MEAVGKQKLNKKLAEWAGFEEKPNAVSFGTIDWPDYVWHDPEGNPRPDGGISNFTQSLDVCFKWLVPKIKSSCLNNYDLSMRGWSDYNGKDQGYYWNICRDDSQVVGMRFVEERIEVAETPALALCLAIEKLIDEGESKVLKEELK